MEEQIRTIKEYKEKVCKTCSHKHTSICNYSKKCVEFCFENMTGDD